MCDFRIDADEMRRDFPDWRAEVDPLLAEAAREFGDMVDLRPDGLRIPEQSRPLTRMIARVFDAYDLSKAGHSPAV